MIYPGYQLNPSDMFQVEPERVLFATGAPKDPSERRAGRRLRLKQKSTSADDASSDIDPPLNSQAPPKEPDVDSKALEDPRTTLKSLLTRAKSVLATTDIPAKKKQDLRAFKKLVQSTLARSNTSTNLTDSLDAQLLELTGGLNISTPSSKSEAPASTEAEEPAPVTLTADDRRALRDVLAEARENPIDPTKPYATPWRPRDYMSAFAFVPRYLEVHHKICSAVYLRHPVARPGLAEVPTPFPGEVNGLAFNWYLRRR